MSCPCEQLRLQQELTRAPASNVMYRLILAVDRNNAQYHSHCPLCRLVQEAFTRTQQNTLHLSVVKERATQDLRGADATVLGLHLHLPDASTQKFGRYLPPTRRTSSVQKFAQLIPLGTHAHLLGKQPAGHTRRLHPYHADRACIKGWLQKCKQDHPGCRLPANVQHGSYTGPKRLVDVTKMCVQQAPYSTDDYLCLSYVWGNISRKVLPYRLYEDTLCSGYLLSVQDYLHPVVRNAIQLTRELGETYLWVDSLCIHQTDVAQKLDDMSKMDQIFSGAAMTIVALDSVDANDTLHGVAAYANPRVVDVIEMDGVAMMRIDQYSPFVPYRRQTQRGLVARDGPEWERQPGEAARLILEKVFPGQYNRDGEGAMHNQIHPWHSRRWTMQEAMFSRRRLLLTAEQAYFSCQTGSEAEYCIAEARSNANALNFNLNAFSNYTTGEMSRNSPASFLQTVRNLLAGSTREVQSVSWTTSCHTIQAFSDRLSNFPEDRYLAFRGIENGQVKTWNFESVAGLPVKILPLALLWCHRPNADSDTVDRIPLYPSWSWIGWNGPVTFALIRSLRSVFFELKVRTISIQAVNEPAARVVSLSFDRTGQQVVREDQQVATGTSPDSMSVRIQELRDSLCQPVPHAGGTLMSPLRLSFSAQYVTLSPHRFLLDHKGALKTDAGTAGRLLLSEQGSFSSHRDGIGLVLMGTSRRSRARLYRTQYRPRGKESRRDRIIYRLIHLVALTPLAVSEYYMGKAFMHQQKHSIETDPDGSASLAPGWSFGMSLVLMLGLLVIYRIVVLILAAPLANVICVRAVGNGLYERVGVGEIGLREFQKLRPSPHQLVLV